MLGIVLLAGCASSGTMDAPPTVRPPDWPTVRAAWNARADSIESLYARGIFEARWVDEDGNSRFEQGDLDVWYMQPDRLATRVSKFGETYAVAGMNEREQWLYLDGEESVLFIGERTSGRLAGFQSMPTDPAFYRVVLGLGRFAAGPDPEITWDDEAGARCMAMKAASAELPSSIWIEPEATYPSRFEFARDGAARRLLVDYDMDRTRTVSIPGRPVLSQPMFSNAMTIRLMQGDTVESRSMVVLDRMTVDVEDEPVDRVFDLDIMQRGLAPDRIERLDAAPAASEPRP